MQKLKGWLSLHDIERLVAGPDGPGRLIGHDSWRRARARSAWATCLASLGHPDEAKAILVRSREVLERELGPDATATVGAARRVALLG
jgi:hypothetical protein